MEPAIGRSIQVGFDTANRSWLAMILFAAVSLLLLLLVGLLVQMTGIPDELRQPLTTSPQVTGSRLPSTGVSQTTAGLPAAPSSGVSSSAAQTGQKTAAAPDPQEALSQQLEARGGMALEWLGRAWLALLFCGVLFVIGSLWLQGGQIGYLAQMVTAQRAPLSALWTAGTKALKGLLGAWLLTLLAAGGVAAVFALLLGLAQLLSAVVPGWLLALPGMLVVLSVLGALVWLGVRLIFWNIGIVVEHHGPVAGLRDTFRLTKGRWGQLLLLGVLLALMFFGVGIIFGLLGWLGRLMGGPAASATGWLVSALRTLANFYFGFWATAAYLQYYQDVKSLSTNAPSGAASA